MIHSYAARVLRQKGIEIFVGPKKILNEPYRKSYLPLTTKILKGNSFRKEFLGGEQPVKIKDMEELNLLGFKIVKGKARGDYYDYQKVKYSLVRLNHPITKLELVEKFDSEHHVEYDPINRCVTGVGKRFSHTGRGHPIPIKQAKPERYKTRAKSDPLNISLSLKSARSMLKRDSPLIRQEEYFEIPELVVGVTEDAYICTLEPPKRTDPYFLEIFGGRGQGKSMLEDNLECGFYHKFRSYCANVNDLKPESHTRCLEWEEGEFKKELSRFGEPSLPLPAVYLHPTTAKDYPRIHFNEVGFDVSIPFKQLLKDENLLKYNPSWKLKTDTSGIAYKRLVKKEGKTRYGGILSANNLAEVNQIIEGEVREPGMRSKLQRVMSDIFNSRVIDKSSNVTSKWLIKQGGVTNAESAWNVCMLAGCFPYLITSGIRDQVWFPMWLRYVISDILDFATLNRINVQLFFDEIAPLMKKKVTREIIEQMVRECRSAGAGATFVSHAYGDVPAEIHLHNPISFIFKSNEPKLLAAFKHHKRMVKEIPNLKPFECWAVGDFKLYDTDGSSHSNDGQPVKIIKIKPPNCQHYGG